MKLLHIQWTRFNLLSQGVALKVFHYEIRPEVIDAEIIEGHDIRMLKCGHDPRLLVGFGLRIPVSAGTVQALDGNTPLQLMIPAVVNRAQSPLTDGLNELIALLNICLFHT